MMFCIILIILDFSVLSRQNMKIKNAENKQTIKQYSAYAKNVFENTYIYNDSRMEGLNVSIEEASEIVGSEYINADKYLQDIVRDKRYWETKRQNIRKREKQMEETISKYETEIQELEKSRKEILRKAKEFGVDVGSPAILEWANRY